MTAEDQEIVDLWQRNRDKGLPPHLRLNEPTTREDFSRLHDDTMAMLRADRVLELSRGEA